MPVSDSMRQAIGARMRDRRKAVGMTQQAVADATEIDRAYIARIETGVVAPNLRHLVRIAVALKTTPNHLLGYST